MSNAIEDAISAPIDARVISLQELDSFNIEEKDRLWVQGIVGVYVYDKNAPVCCCEMTPSYELRHVYYEVNLAQVADNFLKQEEKDDLCQKYEQSGAGDNQDKYVHCRVIDALEERLNGVPFRYRVHGSPGVSFDDVPRDEQMDSLVEHFNCNHPL